MEKHDRLYSQLCITANKPLTEKQWIKIHQTFGEAIENAILESETLTAQIGNVSAGSPFDGYEGFEICV